MTENLEVAKVETEDIESSNTVASDSEATPQVIGERAIALRTFATDVIKGIGPRWKAYRRQWPKTFFTWFLSLLVLSLIVWRFIPGSVAMGTYTPAQGLLVPISVFAGPAILAAFIASHSGIEWYSNTVAVKGLGLIKYFFKFRALVQRALAFFHKGEPKNPTNRVIDLPFPGLGYQAFHEQYLSTSETVTSQQILETVARYQLDNLGGITLNFLSLYLLIKLPAIILWEVASLTLEWGVYWVGFWVAHIPFPTLTLYHWELFVTENLAVAIVIFFQEVKIDTQRTP